MTLTSDFHTLAKCEHGGILVPNPKHWARLARTTGDSVPTDGFFICGRFDSEVRVPEHEVSLAYGSNDKFCEVIWPRLFRFTKGVLSGSIGNSLNYGMPISVGWQANELGTAIDVDSPASAPALPMRFVLVHTSRTPGMGCFSYLKALIMLTRSGRLATVACRSPKIDWGQSSDTFESGLPPYAAFNNGGKRTENIDKLLKSIVLAG